MPFTPFHMGPRAAVKAVTGHHFSLTVFGFSQVLIDLEPLVRILRHDTVLHGLAWVSALVGTFSHVWLDSFMHHDMHPWMPLSQGNDLLGLVV